MQRPPILSLLALAFSLDAGHAMALGFGKVDVTTALGRPLRFSVNLRFDTAEGLEPGCVAAEVVVGDRPLRADQVQARLVRVGSSGERNIRVTTAIPIDEPTLNVTVHAGCPAQLSRSFVVFADPPQILVGTGDAQSDPDPDDEIELHPTSPLVAAVPVETVRAVPGGHPSPRLKPTKRRQAAAVPPIAASTPSRKARAAPPTAAARSSRPVLQLDPLEQAEVAQPSLRVSSALGSTPAASGLPPVSVSEPDAAQRQEDQARLKALEASVQQLRDNEQAKERILRTLQTQLRTAERDRYANPVTYTLAGLCAALAVGLVGVLRLRRRDRQQAEWWAGKAAAAESEVSEPVDAPALPNADKAAVSPPVPQAHATAPTPRIETLAPSTFDVRSIRREPSAAATAEPRRPMSAEELIDLEQQADFFVVLGQDEAAIDLLMIHVRSTSGVSPLPYLKLLEIYRRRDEREPYERIRERFNRRFNAYAPEWGVDPDSGHDLAGYPEVLQRLQGIWQAPSTAMELLDSFLFRRDVGPSFDVPAYRELLFLYGIARDMAERDFQSTGVDLLLPLDGDEIGPDITLVASRASAGDGVDFERIALDLDVSTDLSPNLRVEIPPAHALDDGRGLDFQVDERNVSPRR